MVRERLQTRVGGLRAIELYYRGIREFESGDTTFLQSKTRLNTPELGTLMPETYRKVSEFSNQCISLFELEFAQALEAIKNMQERDIYFRWLSVYMPVKYLSERGMQQSLMQKLDAAEVDMNRVCFELSPDILITGKGEDSTAIEQLRNRGFHFMITDFGGINSPLMRLAYFPVDYVMLSSEVLGYLSEEGRGMSAVEAIVEFSESMGAETIADGVANARQAELLYGAQVKFGAGPLAGNYVAERYMRKKGTKDEPADLPKEQVYEEPPAVEPEVPDEAEAGENAGEIDGEAVVSEAGEAAGEIDGEAVVTDSGEVVDGEAVAIDSEQGGET